MTRHILTICVLSVASLSAQAPQGQQQPSDFKGVVRKNLAPISNEILRVKFPKPTETKLKNGMTLLVIEDHRSPTVSVEIAMPFSGLNEPMESYGLSSATAEMLTLGTKTLNAREIAEKLADLGASMGASTGERYSYIRFSGLTENLDPLIALLQDVLLNPSFPQDELDKWKARMLANLKVARSQPQFLAAERFQAVLYPSDIRAMIAPTPESIAKITREAVVEFYNKNFRPDGGLVAVSGDTSAKQIAAKLDSILGEWKGAPPKQPDLPMREAIAEKKIYLIHRPNSVQTIFNIGNRAIDRRSPDYIPAMVMNRVLGQGPAARLFRNIREDKGYTYGIGSNFSASHFRNHFQLDTSVRTEVTGPALEEILKEFRDIRDRGVPAEELDLAKRALVASFALGTESPAMAIRNALTIREYGFPADYWDTYPEKVMKVTTEDVQRVAKKYVPMDNLQIIAVGDAAKIRETLAKFGPVEEWDAEGQKVK